VNPEMTTENCPKVWNQFALPREMALKETWFESSRSCFSKSWCGKFSGRDSGVLSCILTVPERFLLKLKGFEQNYCAFRTIEPPNFEHCVNSPHALLSSSSALPSFYQNCRTVFRRTSSRFQFQIHFGINFTGSE